MYALCDIGGTQTRIALAEGNSLTTEPVIFATPKDYKTGLKQITTHMRNLLRDRELSAIAIGVAGSLNKENTELFNAPHLPLWNDQPLVQDLKKQFNTHIFLENDTAMVGLGEAVYGAGKDQSIIAYLTVSTGVGGVRVVNGRLDEHALGFEPGHQIIMDPESGKQDSDSKTCPSCLRFGHLEDFISGSALEERYGKQPSAIHDDRVWDDVARYLAYGINNTLVYWSPNVVVLGGGLIVHKAINLDKVNVYLKRIVKIFPELPPIKKNELGDAGGLYGALAYINNNLN